LAGDGGAVAMGVPEVPLETALRSGRVAALGTTVDVVTVYHVVVE